MAAETSSIKTMIDHINDQCDENFRFLIQPGTEDQFISLFNGEDLITEDWDYEIEARLMQIVKENGVQIEWPENHLQSMKTVDDIIKHDPLGLLGDD